MANPRQLLQTLGLHPLAAFGLVAVDWMLFGAEGAVVTTAITVPVGFALGFACSLVQRHAYKDSWGAALGKGVIMGVLTAIPTGLPSILNAVGGGLGLIHLLQGSQGSGGQADAPQVAGPIDVTPEAPRRIGGPVSPPVLDVEPVVPPPPVDPKGS